MKAPVSTLGCVLAKTLAFWRVANVIEVANLEVHFTGLVVKVWTAGVCKRRCLGTQDRHLAVRSVDTGHSVRRVVTTISGAMYSIILKL